APQTDEDDVPARPVRIGVLCARDTHDVETVVRPAGSAIPRLRDGNSCRAHRCSQDGRQAIRDAHATSPCIVSDPPSWGVAASNEHLPARRCLWVARNDSPLLLYKGVSTITTPPVTRMSGRMYRLSGLALGLALLVSRSLSATQAAASDSLSSNHSPRIARAHVVATPPIIDGRLTDPVWQTVEPLTGFVQRELHEGAPVTERTEVRIITDGQALYVGAWLYDSDHGGIVGGEKVRDGDISKSDYFGILLDTYHDRQNGFVFTTTPAAIEHDAQLVPEAEGGGTQPPGQTRAIAGSLGGFNLNWDGTWTVATSVDSAGWYAEFRIPFTTLRYGASQTQTWGLNLVRSIRRKNEEAFWSAIPRQFSLMKISRAGTLEGVQVPSRHVATVTPYALAGVERIYAIDPEARERQEVGGEIKYGLTQSLTLDLTYNTDFAQVEVDEVRTNLTRFPLFYPEKRPFFLENAGIFSAGTPQAVDLFFTRRIGIDALGQPVPIVGGGRITGRLGGLTVGALHSFTDRATTQGAMSYSVLRLQHELAARSRIGVIAIQRTATAKSGA